MTRLSISVGFSDDRGWVARFRGPDYDRKLTVPLEEFRTRGVAAKVDDDRRRRIAEQWAYNKREDLEREAFGGAARRKATLEEIWDLWLRRNPDQCLPDTVRRNRAMKNHLVAAAGDRLPETLDSGFALDYFNQRVGEGASSRTAQNELGFLAVLLRYGWEWDVDTGMEKCRLIRLPRLPVSSEAGVALSIEEVGRLLSTTLHRGTERVHGIIQVGIVSMLRRTPLLGYQRPWLDRKRLWRTVPKEWMKKGRAKVRRELSVPVSRWEADLVARGSGLYVFPNPVNGGPTKTIEQSLVTLCDQAAVRRISHHDLRFTGSTWLAKAGVKDAVRSALMGHVLAVGQGNATAIYDLMDEERLREGVEVFDRIRREHFGNMRWRRRSQVAVRKADRWCGVRDSKPDPAEKS